MNKLFEFPPEHRFCVRPRIVSALERYFNERRYTGHYLRAILENDLMFAVKRADVESRIELPTVIDALIGHAPSNAWGSKEAVAKWLGES